MAIAENSYPQKMGSSCLKIQDPKIWLSSKHPVYCVFSTSADVQYIGGCSVHRGDTMSTSGDTMSTSRGYHEYIGGIS